VQTAASCTRTKWSYLAGVDKPTLPTIYSLFGKTASAHCSSLGKAILAHFPEAELQALLAAAPLESMTPHSVARMRWFMKELETVRKQGYAVDREGHVFNLCCVAVPIFDNQRRIVGSIGISGEAVRPLLEHLSMLRQKAELIGHRALIGANRRRERKERVSYSDEPVASEVTGVV
jgi:DNA-binding IclR family transcriptional regulator